VQLPDGYAGRAGFIANSGLLGPEHVHRLERRRRALTPGLLK
jgi:hypothetical protein